MDYKWTISKSFNFEAGHRVWAQQLNNPELSISTACSCRHLHGHSYTIKVHLGSNTLDQSGMVTDFKNLNFVKKFVDEVLDHKFMIDVNDPLFHTITGMKWAPGPLINFTNFTNLGELCSGALPLDADTLMDEFVDSFVLVDFIPTSENICKHIKQYVQAQIKDFATVVSVELWETAKSHCEYTGE